MKILILNYEFPPLGGGAANATYYLLKEFSKFKDLEIDLVTSSVDDFKIEKFSKNIRVHYLNINKKGNLHYQSNKDLLTYSWRAYRYSRKLMKEKQFDLCHAFFGIPCGYVAMKLGLPYIVSLRGSDVPFYNPRFYWLDKLFFKRVSKKVWSGAKRVVANSEHLKENALKINSLQPIDIISNGVDTRKFSPIRKKKMNEKLNIISVGRLTRIKGYEYVIEALSNDSESQLLLVGDGPLKDELKELAKKNNSQVNFLGIKPQKEVISYLRNADIFILPSINEGMSNALLEAMACGLPVIVTDTGGSNSFVKDNGVIVKKESVDDIKKAIQAYKGKSSIIKKQGEISRKYAEALSWNKVAEGYLGVYKQ